MDTTDRSLADHFLTRLERETKGLGGDDLARYLAHHVGIGVAFMRGAIGEEWTREFIMAAFAAADVHGTDTLVKDGVRIVVPREPSAN